VGRYEVQARPHHRVRLRTKINRNADFLVNTHIYQALPVDSASILVTGGTGFVGRSLVDKLAAAGQSVRILSRSGRSAELPNVSIYRGDLTSQKDLKAAIKGCKIVFHCAAERTDEDIMTAVNVTATRNLFELARDMRIGYFCHMSSVGVIGRTRRKVVNESAECNPMNEYEATKLAAEEIVRGGLGEGRVVILRPTNIFGPATLRPMLRHSFRSQLRAFLKGNESAHLVYIGDVVAAAIYWMQAGPAKSAETFIVSSDEEPGNAYRDIQTFLASRVQGAPRPVKFSAPLLAPYCARLLRHGKTNYGDLIYSSSKIKRAGFSFPFGLGAGLDAALKALLESGDYRAHE
jgi:nucleoside-diphosphate-sugar epimerase